jgi:hypothetical protein
MSLDPVGTNPQHYRVVFENDRVRVSLSNTAIGDSVTITPALRQ